MVDLTVKFQQRRLIVRRFSYLGALETIEGRELGLSGSIALYRFLCLTDGNVTIHLSPSIGIYRPKRKDLKVNLTLTKNPSVLFRIFTRRRASGLCHPPLT